MKHLLLAAAAVIVLLSPAHASPNSTLGSPGVARICLTDNDVHLGPKDEIVIPATTVFEDDGPNTGKAEDPSTWKYEVKERFTSPVQFLTLSAVSLRKGKTCA